jgi:hypothetical protein
MPCGQPQWICAGTGSSGSTRPADCLDARSPHGCRSLWRATRARPGNRFRLRQRRYVAKNLSALSQASLADSDSGPTPATPRRGEARGAGFGAVEESVAGGGVFLDVVGHACFSEGRSWQIGGGAPPNACATKDAPLIID